MKRGKGFERREGIAGERRDGGKGWLGEGDLKLHIYIHHEVIF